MGNEAVFLNSPDVKVAAAGALSGDGSIGDPLAVNVDDVTIEVNGSNQLKVKSGGTIGPDAFVLAIGANGFELTDTDTPTLAADQTLFAAPDVTYTAPSVGGVEEMLVLGAEHVIHAGVSEAGLGFGLSVIGYKNTYKIGAGGDSDNGIFGSENTLDASLIPDTSYLFGFHIFGTNNQGTFASDQDGLGGGVIVGYGNSTAYTDVGLFGFDLVATGAHQLRYGGDYPVFLDATTLTIPHLNGTGTQFACLDADGKLIRSATACA